MCTLIMVLGLSIINLFIPCYSASRGMSIIYIIIYGSIGVVLYFIVAYKSNTISDILGKNFIIKIKQKINKKTINN